MKKNDSNEKIWNEYFGGVLFIIDEGISRDVILQCDIPLNEGGLLMQIGANALFYDFESKKLIGEEFFENEKRKSLELRESVKNFHGITIAISSTWTSSSWGEMADINIIFGTKGYATYMAGKANKYIMEKKSKIFLHADTTKNLCKLLRKILNISNENMVGNAGVLAYGKANLALRQELLNKSKI